LPYARLKDKFDKLPQRIPLPILCGDSDPSMPPSVNKDERLSRWTEFTQEGGSTVGRVNGDIVSIVNHNLNDNPPPIVQYLIAQVIRFTVRLDHRECASQNMRICDYENKLDSHALPQRLG